MMHPIEFTLHITSAITITCFEATSNSRIVRHLKVYCDNEATSHYILAPCTKPTNISFKNSTFVNIPQDHIYMFFAKKNFLLTH